MNYTRVKRLFTASFVKIIARADNLHRRAVKYQPLLEKYGITIAFLAQFKQKVQACLTFQYDKINLVEVSLSCAEADAAARHLRATIRGIVRRAAMAFGRKSLEYSYFRAGRITKARQYNLLEIANNVRAKAVIYLPQLSAFGLTQAMIDDFAAETAAFQQAVTAATDQKDRRIAMTNERTLALNALFADMKHIAEAGKDADAANPLMIADMFALYDAEVSRKSAAAAKKRRAAKKKGKE